MLLKCKPHVVQAILSQTRGQQVTAVVPLLTSRLPLPTTVALYSLELPTPSLERPRVPAVTESVMNTGTRFHGSSKGLTGSMFLAMPKGPLCGVHGLAMDPMPMREHEGSFILRRISAVRPKRVGPRGMMPVIKKAVVSLLTSLLTLFVVALGIITAVVVAMGAP